MAATIGAHLISMQQVRVAGEEQYISREYPHHGALATGCKTFQFIMTVGKCKPDRIWSISGEHEIVLKQSWAVVLKQWGYDLDNMSFTELEKPSNYVSSKSQNKLPTISSTSIVPECPAPTKRTTDTFHAVQGKADSTRGEFDFTVPELPPAPYQQLAKFKTAQLHQAFFNSLRNDSPDNNFLRFVRARKFKLQQIIHMAASCLQWKVDSHPVDKWTMEGDAVRFFNNKNPEMIQAFGMEKAYFRGRDHDGGPICVIKVKKHFGLDCPEKDFEVFICLIIEWFRFALTDYGLGNDGANILFDMSGFSLKNADLTAVKFLAKAFEANYPECLSAIWIHKAPWIFNAVWKIIRGWLDPVVASKVHFTKSAADLEAFVDKKWIPKDLGGDDDYKPTYVTPTKENSAKKPKDETYKKLKAQRELLCLTFLETTLAWIHAKTTEESTKLLQAKIQLGAELAKNYIALDPYIRWRGAFDRDGSLGEMKF